MEGGGAVLRVGDTFTNTKVMLGHPLLRGFPFYGTEPSVLYKELSCIPR